MMKNEEKEKPQELDHCYICGDLKPTKSVSFNSARENWITVETCAECETSKVEVVRDAILVNGRVQLFDPVEGKDTWLEDLFKEFLDLQTDRYVDVKITIERLPTIDEKIDRIASILQLHVASLGGNIRGFWFEKGNKELIFGYASGMLGYQLCEIKDDNRGDQIAGDDLVPCGATVVEECRAIINTLQKYGFEYENLLNRLSDYTHQPEME